MKKIILTISLLILVSCTPKVFKDGNVNITQTQYLKKIIEGKTQKSEIIDLFGVPNATNISGNEETVSYVYTRVNRGWLSIKESGAYVLNIYFRNDIMFKYEVQQSGKITDD